MVLKQGFNRSCNAGDYGFFRTPQEHFQRPTKKIEGCGSVGGNPFDKIFASAPVNRATAKALLSKGEHFVSAMKTGRETYDTPPRMRPPRASELDLVGRAAGRLTVVGLHDETGRKHGARWVVRCVCGSYEMRSAKAIRGPFAHLQRCSHCEINERLVHIDRVRQFGERVAVQMREQDQRPRGARS